MTRARTQTHGLVIPPLSQLLLTAALCAFVSLVQGAVSTLQMIRACLRRDWHTTETGKALPRETSGTSQTGTAQRSPSCSDKRNLARVRRHVRHEPELNIPDVGTIGSEHPLALAAHAAIRKDVSARIQALSHKA